MTNKNTEINKHIRSKIEYHDKLRIKYVAEEEFLLAAKERDEIKRLKGLIEDKV